MKLSLERFYELKQKYMKKYNNKKSKIKSIGDLTKTEKKKLIKEIKAGCVVCNKEDTKNTFSQENNTLIAKCNKCLGFTAEREEHIYIPPQLKILKDDLKEIKNDIIKNKLDLLFEYTSMEQMEQMFSENKESYKFYSDLISLFENTIENRKQNNNLIQAKKIIMKEKLSIYKTIINDYENTQEPPKLTEAIDYYLNSLLPSIKEYRDAVYKDSYIMPPIKNINDNYKLVNVTMDISDYTYHNK